MFEYDVRISDPRTNLTPAMFAEQLQSSLRAHWVNDSLTVTALPSSPPDLHAPDPPAKPSGAEAAKGAAVANQYSYPSVKPGETYGQMRFREGVLRLLGMLVDSAEKEHPDADDG